MHFQTQPLDQQVMVITGATSGIGLSTARMAAQRGARVILAARSADALSRLADEINQAGGQADFVVADMANRDEVERIADRALERFGRIDTWVNNAGVSIYGRMEEVSIEDHRRLFETNFWGVVHGSFAALRQLKAHGGVLINIGSVLSDRAIPLQGMYSASKHAVKGFTDALRMELEKEGAPVAVVLIKPSAIDTPYIQHARNYFADQPMNPPPVYAPEVVARAIVHCATCPHRDVVVGGGGKAISMAGKWMPRIMDKAMQATMFSAQHSGKPARGRREGLYEGSGDLEERGGYPGHVSTSSVYTQAALHPGLSLLAIAGMGLAVAGIMGALGGTRRGPGSRPSRERPDHIREREPVAVPMEGI